jgi:hypothetical protein
MMISMVEPQTIKAYLIEVVSFSAPKASPVAKAHAIILTIIGALHRTKAGFGIFVNTLARSPPPLAEVRARGYIV